MAGDRVLVTGGAGFIGSHTVDLLLEAGYEPHVVDDLSSGRRENLPATAPLYEVNICDTAAMSRVFTEVRPRFVVHLAAQMSVSRSVREPAFDAEVNILGLVQLLEQCVRTGVERVVFASSGGVLYGEGTTPATEDRPARPISPYGLSKWAGEQYLRWAAREHGLQSVALRYGNVYGPRQNPHGEAGVVAIFAQKLLAGVAPTINGDGQYVRDYVYVGDVARANLLALTAPLPEAFVALNIGTGAGTDVNALAQQLRAALVQALRASGQAPDLPAPQYGPPRPGDLRSNMVDPGRAGRVLGWTPRVPLAEGLLATAEWFMQQAVHTMR